MADVEARRNGGEARALDEAYRLEDCYARPQGRVFLTGTEALVRILLDQRRLDRRDGRRTAGFVSGYRGSPLGGLDMALWRAQTFLDAEDIVFRPAVNEELAATAIMGTQQVESDPERTVEGVFALWYGKGPGADRAGDALKHGTAYGSSPTGGVLVVVGDDHGCVSSSMSHQSDPAMQSWYMPVVHPASVAEYRDFGLWGIAASRFSGAWIGFKAISETVESGQTVELGPLPQFRLPGDYTPPEDGLHYRWPDLPGMQVERRNREKMKALAAFARANPLDRPVLGEKGAAYGIVAAGKGYLDLMAALDRLGIDDARARALGLAVYKVGLVWPLEAAGVLDFAAGKRELLVVEEKRGLIEDQVKVLLHDRGGASPPRVFGKRGPAGEAWIDDVDELRPSRLLDTLAAWLGRIAPEVDLRACGEDAAPVVLPGDGKRQPYFCSGCPHNRSTLVPEGSRAFAGIGCHFMATWMDRQTTTLIQMGGEGVHWVGRAPFVGNGHAFQNLGDGTYFHSGQIALRQAVAAGINMTYKILFNDAVAMTGGQPVDGTLSVDRVARQVRAEGVERIAVLSDEPGKYHGCADFPEGTTIHHRDELLAVEEELRAHPGVSVLIYDQACAAEKRRKRKRHLYPDPPRRVFINERVCEGCGDCSVQSNCLSVVPAETAFGRKRRIEQSSCNKDYSCIDGFCPSFVTVEGEGLALNKAAAQLDAADLAARLARLPAPQAAAHGGDANILVTGVGGTGVVTIGRIVSMAAHLEGRSASVLDFMGFAQKGGAVLSHVRLRAARGATHPVRIDRGETDLLLACDIVVATDAEPLASLARGRSRAIVNQAVIPTADYVRDIRADLDYAGRIKALKERVGARRVTEVEAYRIAERLLGDTVYANMFLLGFAWQQGAVPLGEAALRRAITLNGVAVENNLRAFELGRLAADDPAFIAGLMTPPEAGEPETLAAIVAHRSAELARYQDETYAAQYRALVEKARSAEEAAGIAEDRLARAVARNLYKLMAYKDEYEVARLYTDGAFARALEETFAGDYALKLHLAPPLLAWRKDARGRPKKMAFRGRWLLPALRLLARARRLRGTRLDPFGYHPDRRLERQLIADYRILMRELLGNLGPGNYDIAVALAELPDRIRGFGPVKAENVTAAKAEEARLLAAFRRAGRAGAPATTRRIAGGDRQSHLGQ